MTSLVRLPEARQEASIRFAVRSALLTSGTAMLAVGMPAQAQQDEVATRTEEVIVTGSRIRRVDAETASPVYSLDRDTILATGATTIDKLILEAPSIAGNATNPAVNNGGGTGESNVSLRGLGVNRTLVLLNGRRIGALGAFEAVDINQIPVNMIERVEILKEGAGAIYGSDAVAGVVNFITRKDFGGAEGGYDYGISTDEDGRRQAVNLMWSTSGDRSNVMLGANWNKQEAISANDRDFSRFALYLYGDYGVFEGGSSRAPAGRIRLGGTPLAGQFGCSSVTRVAGQDGDALGEYRCFGGGDFYNYQPLNLIMTPQERGSIFALADFNLTDNIQLYTEFLHNYTSSGFQIAPLPFDARLDDVVIPANNVFNPFGIAFGGIDGVNPNAQWRLEGLGNRRSDTKTTADEARIGLRGPLGNSSWTWDGVVQYGRTDQDSRVDGYLFGPALQNAFGPNFRDPITNQVRCGTPTAPINNCTPVNIFNVNDPSQSAALRQISSAYTTNYRYSTKIGGLNLAGDVFSLPAGAIKAATGFEYRDLDLNFTADSNVQAQPPFYTNCILAQETCTGDSKGGYNVKEVYAELFFPLLKDAPGARALNATVGGRFSHYSNFGSTSNFSFKVEYRPVSDIMVRGTYTEVFRAPTISDLFSAPVNTSSQFNDPCVGLTQAQVNQNPNYALVCQFVPRTGTFSQDNSQISGLLTGNPNLGAETGEVFTYGLVYDPSWARGLSMSVDFWDYKIEDTITTLDVNTIADQCLATGSNTFCSLISRFQSDGTIFQIQQPTVNLGETKTRGIDFGMRYRLRETPFGAFNFSLDTTYIDRYDNTPEPGAETVRVAGTFDRQYGNFARVRGVGGISWAYRDFTTALRAHYIHGIKLLDPDGAPGVQPPLEIPSFTYLDLTLGYTFRENARFQVGIENIGAKQPPIMYQNNVLNANTDVSTYDTVGRFFWGRFNYRF
jgi:iron complex outermembrane recepter protein